MGLSLENLAKIIYTDKQRMFGEECFARHVELAQGAKSAETLNGFFWKARIKHLVDHNLIVTLAIYPLRLRVQWTYTSSLPI